MKSQKIIMVAVLAFIAVTLVTATVFAYVGEPRPIFRNENQAESSFYLGVTFGGNTTAEAKLLIDRVKTYTNLFVVQSAPASKNETSLTEISEYAIDAGLDIVVYFGWLDPNYPWRLTWLEKAKERWGDRFLGVYFGDEPLGAPLDYNWTRYFIEQKLQNTENYQEHAAAIEHTLNEIRHDLNSTYPHDYDEAAAISVNSVKRNLAPLKNQSLTIFTSDYVLYWFGYLGGYDVMLSQFGWNQSITQEIALTRGAARMQNKTWGAIITWKYNEPPYLDTGEEIYRQLLTAYEAGAKYGVIFNYPQIEGNEYGIMTNEHFAALERFWNEKLANPGARNVRAQPEAVLVLPRNYGWGMRRPDDKIWGYWGADDKAAQVWEISRKLLSQYGLRLDIVYEDPAFPVARKYSNVYYWNQTVASREQDYPLILHHFQYPSASMHSVYQVEDYAQPIVTVQRGLTQAFSYQNGRTCHGNGNTQGDGNSIVAERWHS